MGASKTIASLAESVLAPSARLKLMVPLDLNCKRPKPPPANEEVWTQASPAFRVVLPRSDEPVRYQAPLSCCVKNAAPATSSVGTTVVLLLSTKRFRMRGYSFSVSGFSRVALKGSSGVANELSSTKFRVPPLATGLALADRPAAISMPWLERMSMVPALLATDVLTTPDMVCRLKFSGPKPSAFKVAPFSATMKPLAEEKFLTEAASPLGSSSACPSWIRPPSSNSPRETPRLSVKILCALPVAFNTDAAPSQIPRNGSKPSVEVSPNTMRPAGAATLPSTVS